MKQLILLVVLFTAIDVNAQDIIVKRDGTTIISKVLEVGTSEIKYKKFSNQDGPLYSISISDVFCLNYENGDKEQFEKHKTNDEEQNIESNILTTTTGKSEYVLNPGTLIPIKNVNYTRAANLSVGQTVQFRVARDVAIDNMTIIPYGTSVKGTVYQAKKSSWFGTKGRLGININEIELPSGLKIPLNRGNVYITGKNRTPLSVILFLLVTWPACFITGSKAELPAGYEVTAEIARPLIFKVNNGHLVGEVSENLNSNQYNDSQEKQKNVILKIRGGQKIKAILQSEDDIYYYYKLQSWPNGRTNKVKKMKVKEIIDTYKVF